MPNRIIKESICTSDKIAALSDFEFRLWVGLIVNADDCGRGDARPAIIKGRIFPLRERVAIKDIDNALHGLAAAGCVSLYTVGGKPYYAFPTWAAHQRIRNCVQKYPGEDEADVAPQSAASCGELRRVAASCGELRLESNPNPNPNPNTNTNTNCASARECEFANEFVTLWNLYPKKQGKDNALKAYIKAREAGTTVEEVKAGIENYAEYCRVCQLEEKYIKHGSTWFNQHCWSDTYKPTPPTSGGKDIPKGASGTLGAAELEAIQQLLAEGKEDEFDELPF